MFDIGFTELLLIGIVSLVVIGPERLPAVAQTAGQWIGKLQRFVRGVKSDIASELETGDLKKLIGDQREQINELSKLVHSTKRDIESGTREAIESARKRYDEMETSANTPGADASTDSGKTDAQERAADSPGDGDDALAAGNRVDSLYHTTEHAIATDTQATESADQAASESSLIDNDKRSHQAETGIGNRTGSDSGG